MSEKEKKERGEDVQPLEKLTDEDLGKVTGAGNPFDGIPRVPTQPIDEDLRDRV